MPLSFKKCEQTNAQIPLTIVTVDTKQDNEAVTVTVKLSSENSSGTQTRIKNFSLSPMQPRRRVNIEDLNPILDGQLVLQGKLVIFQGWVKTSNLVKVGSVQGIVKILS